MKWVVSLGDLARDPTTSLQDGVGPLNQLRPLQETHEGLYS